MKELTIENIDNFFYLLAFIVPGFITYSTLANFIPQKEETSSSILLRYLTLSCLNYGIWSGFIYYLFQSNQILDPKIKTLVFVLLVFVAPVITGILLVLFSKAEMVRKLLGKFGFNPVHEIPTAWDFKFSKMQDGEWLVIRLKNGKKVAGFFGANSFAGNAAVKDVFIEKVWNFQEDGKWIKVDRTAGILITSDSIETIEFFKDEEKKNVSGP